MTGSGTVRLKRDIGLLGAGLLVLNGLIGAGIFALPGKVAANAGLLSPWLFLLVGLLFLSVVLTFAELASYYERSGGPVLYTRDAFGPLAGFSTGWVLFVSRVTSFAANATVMALYLGSLLPWFATDPGRTLTTVVVIGGLTWVNVLGVKDGVRTMLVLSILKLTPLFLIVGAGLTEVTGITFIPAAPYFVEQLGPTTLLLIYAYVGFETIGITAGETRNPRSNLPRALVATALAIALVYFLIMLVFVSVIPPEAYATATLVDMGRQIAGPLGAAGITVAAVFSIGGNLSQSMIGAPRLLYALGENGLIPRQFAHVSERYRTPSVAIMAMGALALLLALSGTFAQLAVASSLSRLLAYVLSICALPTIRRRASEEGRRHAFRLKGGYLIPLLGLGICLWLIAQTTRENWIAVGALLALGVCLYILEQRFLLVRR